MVIDQQTSGDLEIFRTRDGRPGVFQTLDRTRTPGGSEALRYRFGNPFSDRERISRVQEALRFLLSEEIQFPVDPIRLLEVRQYLASPWDVGSRARGLRFLVESIIVSIRYRDLYQLALRGVGVTRHVLEEIDEFLEEALDRDPPPELMGLLDDMRELIQAMDPGGIKAIRRPWSVFRADRLLRIFRREELDRLLAHLSQLDALLSMAEVTKELGFTFPQVVEGQEFLLEGAGIVHPFLDDPVGNPVSLDGKGKSVLFLTGPNMAGKTTYMKAVAVAAYLAHLGMGVPAERLRFTPLDGLYSSLSPEENLREGLSYFMAEVQRVKTIAQAAARGERTLVLIDEAFRGTNVKDALDASLLVIRGFARSQGSGFIFASHLVELAEDLEVEPQVGFVFFEGRIKDSRASYDFMLKEGVSGQRFGLQLLEEAGVPQILDSLPPRRTS